MGGIFLGVAMVLLLLFLLTLTTLLYQVMRQQGRLLLRLEAVELRVGEGGQARQADGHAEVGLAVGSPFPAFRLPDFTGRLLSLEDYPAKTRLVVHWNPTCGFCERIAPELAELHGRLRAREVELILLSAGDVEANRRLADEHGLRCPILLLDGSEPLEGLSELGTPVAYVLDEEGNVAAPLSIGAEDVPKLALELASGRTRLTSERTLAQSRIERDGLSAGTPAPDFRLPAIDGGHVALEDFRGRRVLLVFSDPDCGPCNALAPDLANLDARSESLAVLVVGRGDLDENRRKAEEHGIEFPVVVQPGWKLSKAYGIFATPVAFLIGANGIIERDVAKGSEQILELAEQAIAWGEEEADHEITAVSS